MDFRESTFGRILHWLKANPYTAVCSVVLAVLAFGFLLRTDSEWEDVYIGAARQMRNGEVLHTSGTRYVYPPFMAWASIPFSYLPLLPARAVWGAINLIAMVLIFRWSWQLTGGQELQKLPAAPWQEHAVALAGAFAGFVYLQNCIAHRQTDVVSAALLIGGCLTLVRSRYILAATCFGLSAAMKYTSLLWAPYLLWRGRPRAAAWLLVVALGVNFLPDITHPSANGRSWFVVQISRFLKPLVDKDHYVGSWPSDIVYNQSLSGAANRWVLTAWTLDPKDCTIISQSALVGPVTLRIIVIAFKLLLVFAVLLVCRRPFRNLETAGDGPTRALLEFSIVLTLMLLFSPMSSRAHFGTLVLPTFLLARAALYQRSRLLCCCLVASLLLTATANKDLVGTHVYTLSLWFGGTTWQTLILLMACCLLLARNNACLQTVAGEGRTTTRQDDATLVYFGLRKMKPPFSKPKQAPKTLPVEQRPVEVISVESAEM